LDPPPKQTKRQILTYTEAVKTVAHDKALGKPCDLWCDFAKFYEGHGDVENARVIFGKAVQVCVVWLCCIVCGVARQQPWQLLHHPRFSPGPMDSFD
jgi:hypothetical protein